MKENFSKRLKEERLINKFTQKQMAEKLNISLRTYQAYETQGKNNIKPSMETLILIAKILDVSLDYLFGLKETL